MFRSSKSTNLSSTLQTWLLTFSVSLHKNYKYLKQYDKDLIKWIPFQVLGTIHDFSFLLKMTFFVAINIFIWRRHFGISIDVLTIFVSQLAGFNFATCQKIKDIAKIFHRISFLCLKINVFTILFPKDDHISCLVRIFIFARI